MNFTVYKSSAGSGKTFTLVKEYLKLALADDQNPPQKYRHILAITFTNKAAAEMKERIIKALKELSEPNKEKNILLDLLKKETGLEESKLKFRAGSILHAILHNYSDFAIGTIDSFVHRIVRTFAYDLQLPINFEIEMDSDKLLTQVIDLLISKAGSDEHLTRALVEFTESKAEDEKSWHIEHDLFNFSKNLLNEGSIIHLDKLKDISTSDFLSIRNDLNEFIKKFENSIQKTATEAYSSITQQGLDVATFFQGRSGIGVYFRNLSEGNFDKLDANSYVLKAIHENKWYTDKAPDTDKDKIDSIKDLLAECYHSIQNILEKQRSRYHLLRLINKNIYSLAVLNEIEKLLVEIKKQNNILHISEFNKIISRIVLNQPIPFIYERIGEKYNHYLVDEFQDTSVLQWQNLLPLIENSLAEGHFNMLVGDGKQAIYRWRGGEVEQFSQLPNVFVKEKNEFVLEREQTLIRNYNEQQLNNNYRSKKEIIEFNNSIFSVLSSKLTDSNSIIYKNLAQQADPANTGGQVSINFVQGETEEVIEQTLAQIHNTIIQLQQDNFKLNDIAILCRTNKNGSVIAEYLTTKGIGVLSPDSLLLKNSKKVAFIESALHYIDQPDNDITRVELFEYLLENKIIPQDLHTLIANTKYRKPREFNALLKQNGIEFNHLQLIKLPLYELVEQLVNIFKLGETADAFVQFFMDEVLSYSIKYNNNLSDFLAWWINRKETASMNIPEGANAVNIMTVHRSKGLEFPVVILPFTGSKAPNKGDMWVDLQHEEVQELKSVLLPKNNELEKTDYADLYAQEKNKALLDDINLLYVALTRPEERMYIISTEPTKKPENMGSVQDMLGLYLQSQQLWSENILEYTFGAGTKHKSKNIKDKPSVKQKKLQSADWRNILKIRASAPEVWNTDEVSSKKDFGLLIHAILAKVKISSDLAPALAQFLNEGIIDSQEKEELLPKLKNIIEHKQLQQYFAEGNSIKTESEIILPTGESYRPDRVVISSTATTVIDYKTGTKQDKHSKQIQKYADLMTEMGYPNVEKYLVYIDDEQIVKV